MINMIEQLILLSACTACSLSSLKSWTLYKKLDKYKHHKNT
jgi:hypothetical protein